MPVISIEKQKADVLRVISDWGETLQFRPARGQPARTIVGHVERVDAAALEQMPSHGGPLFKVMVVNNAAPTMIPAKATLAGATDLSDAVTQAAANQGQTDTLLGVSINEIVIGASVIEIAHRPGQTPQPRTVVKVDDSDEAALFLECR
jgi:hypothetical protein